MQDDGDISMGNNDLLLQFYSCLMLLRIDHTAKSRKVLLLRSLPERQPAEAGEQDVFSLSVLPPGTVGGGERKRSERLPSWGLIIE